MTSENAIQAGSRALAVMNEVSAVIGRLTEPLLSGDDLGQIRPRWPEIAQCFQSQKAYATACGTLENGDGLGWSLIMTYLGSGDADACPRTQHQIRDAIAALKQSGRYALILADVKRRIAAEAEQAEQEAAEAEAELERAKATKANKHKVDAAKTKASTKKRAAASASKARTRADHTAETAAKKNEKVFDERCIKVFSNDEQARAFREAVTTDAARRFIPIDQQLPFAKKLVSETKERDEYRGRITATYIRMYVSNEISSAVRAQKQIDEDERQRLIEQQFREIFDGHFRNLQWSLNGTVANARKLFHFIAENKRFAGDPMIGAFEPTIEEAIQLLTQLLREIVHAQEKTRNVVKESVEDEDKGKTLPLPSTGHDTRH
jgi:hypothetical protein